jgi:hypothetical protein
VVCVDEVTATSSARIPVANGSVDLHARLQIAIADGLRDAAGDPR